MSGPECCANPPSLCSSCGSGQVQVIGGLNSYVSGTPDSDLALLLVTDIYGYEAPKMRKLADKVAAAGYYVVAPDFLNGEPYHPEKDIRDWLTRHPAGKGAEYARLVIEALKQKGLSKIGAAGFCWGAKVVVDLAKDADVQAAVLLHPSLVTIDDIKGVKVPIAILGAEIDQRSPPEVVKEFEAALDAKPEVDHFVKIYPGVSHGWTLRYNDEDEAVVKSAQEAHGDMLNWLSKCMN